MLITVSHLVFIDFWFNELLYLQVVAVKQLDRNGL